MSANDHAAGWQALTGSGVTRLRERHPERRQVFPADALVEGAALGRLGGGRGDSDRMTSGSSVGQIDSIRSVSIRVARRCRSRRSSTFRRSSTRTRCRPLQKRLLLLCFLVVAIDGFDTAIIGFIAPAIRAEWGLAVVASGPALCRRVWSD